MKYLLIFFCFTASAQVKMNGYISYPNAATHIPDSVIYTVTPHSKVAKRLAGFHGTPNLERDYKGSGYDIGHNADAEDMDYSFLSEYDSFNFFNTFPQRPKCNRITWLALENYVRSLSQPVRVRISYIGINGHIGADSVAVPLICVKDIWYGDKHERYEVPNSDTVNKHVFTYYRVK